jgi:hypothetical protein
MTSCVPYVHTVELAGCVCALQTSGFLAIVVPLQSSFTFCSKNWDLCNGDFPGSKTATQADCFAQTSDQAFMILSSAAMSGQSTKRTMKVFF